MIVFRADGNSEIGSGHIMRCLSLADAFREEGVRSIFIIAGNQLQSLIQERGFNCVVLNSTHDKLEDELYVLIPLIKKIAPQMIILDSYFVTPKYMTEIKKEALLVYIDDLNMFDYPADILVNYNIYTDKMQYQQNKLYLLGTQYAPLRKEFYNTKKQHASTVKNVLFSTGGADQEHVALRCISYLKKHPELQMLTYHFVIGVVNQDVTEIEKETYNLPYIRLHQQVKDMKSLMMLCDIAVSAGGTTLYELCACGVPTVTYILADNQIMAAKEFEEKGIMFCAGDVRKNLKCEREIFKGIKKLYINKEIYIMRSQKMRGIVDGLGSERIKDFCLSII